MAMFDLHITLIYELPCEIAKLWCWVLVRIVPRKQYKSTYEDALYFLKYIYYMLCMYLTVKQRLREACSHSASQYSVLSMNLKVYYHAPTRMCHWSHYIVWYNKKFWEEPIRLLSVPETFIWSTWT
jgi:hypothetical protein